MADHVCPDCGAVHKEKRTSLKQRVEMLEGRVASLEARVPFQWSYTPDIKFYPNGSPELVGTDITITND